MPTVVATGIWGTGATGVTMQKANLPSGIQAGDLILVIWVRAGAVGVGTLQSPWTDLANQVGANPPLIACRMAYQIAASALAAGDVDLVSLASADRGSSLTYVIRGFTGLPAFRPFDVQNSSTAPSPGPLTSGFGAVDTLWLAMLFGEYGAGTITAYPPSYTNGFDGGAAGPSCVASARRELAAASEDPGAWTLSVSDNSYCSVVAIQGVAAPAATPSFRALII